MTEAPVSIIESTMNGHADNFIDLTDSFSNLCRLCGQFELNMTCIFDSNNKYDFCKVINTHFQDFQITETDVLPLKLCVNCTTTLLAWHAYHTNCVNVNERFKSMQYASVDMKVEKIEYPLEDNIDDNLELRSSELENSCPEENINEDIEVIEIKVNEEDGEMCPEEESDDPSGHEDVYDDIANIHMHDIPDFSSSDASQDLIVKDEKLDSEEMAILHHDLNTKINDAVEDETEKTVEQPLRKNEKLNKFKKSTVCRICGKLYVTRASYLRHLLKQHSNHASVKKNTPTKQATDKIIPKKPLNCKKKEEPSRIMCDACGKTFRFASSYRKHARDQHSDGPPKPKPLRSRRMCDLCGKMCSGGSFKGHMKKHTNPESVTCKHCGLLFSFESVLKSHIRVRHSTERPFQCELCDSNFKRADYLRSHMRYKHEPKLLRTEDKGFPYRCGDCDSSFKNQEALDKHHSYKADSGMERKCPAVFRCGECQITFKRRNYLTLHKRYVHDKQQPFRISEASIGPYKCDKCERRFASVCGRNYHCKSVHGSTYDTKFSETCDHCGLTFKNRVFYAKHCAKLRDKPTCYLCWSAFDEDDALKQHMHNVHVDDLPFLCELCRNRFVTMRQLTDHIRSRHAKIRPFKCGYCQHTSVRKDSLEVHIRGCHLGQKPYKCDLCEKAFSQSSDLRKHRVTHTRNKVAPVKKKKIILGETFPTNVTPVPYETKTEATENVESSELKEESASEETSITAVSVPNETVKTKPKSRRHRLRICHLCGKNYYTDSGFRHHMVMHKEPNFFCHLCGRVFYESQNLKKHINTIHSEERPFQCHMCGTKYKRKDVLQEHIKRVHDGVKRVWNSEVLKKSRLNSKEPVKERFQCPHCNKCMASKAYLNDHINGVHTKKQLHKCNECSMSFTRIAAFKYHFKRAHILKKRILEPRGTFLKDCEYCGLPFRVKKYYDIHVASKHFNKYPCERCEQIFDNKFHLTKHTENDHADQLSKCDFCGKCFAEDVHLKRHVYLCHTPRNPYECYHCGHKANKKSTLTVHMRRHTGEKPYLCDVCNRRFAQSVDYRKHCANHFKNKDEEHVGEIKEDDDVKFFIQPLDVTADNLDEKNCLNFETVRTANHVE